MIVLYDQKPPGQRNRLHLVTHAANHDADIARWYELRPPETGQDPPRYLDPRSPRAIRGGGLLHLGDPRTQGSQADDTEALHRLVSHDAHDARVHGRIHGVSQKKGNGWSILHLARVSGGKQGRRDSYRLSKLPDVTLRIPRRNRSSQQ